VVPYLVGAAALFEVGSLATLVITRHTSWLSWMESGWSVGAQRSLALEVGALLNLAILAVAFSTRQRTGSEQRGPVQLAVSGLVAA
jgi:hypothetical protein